MACYKHLFGKIIKQPAVRGPATKWGFRSIDFLYSYFNMHMLFNATTDECEVQLVSGARGIGPCDIQGFRVHGLGGLFCSRFAFSASVMSLACLGLGCVT